MAVRLPPSFLRHLSLSLSPHISRDSIDLVSDGSPACSEDEFLSSVGITVSHYEFDQSNADPARADDGIGTSACANIQAKLAHRFLTAGTPPDLNRAEVAQWVRDFDDLRLPAGAYAQAMLKDIFKTTPEFEVLVSEYVPTGDPPQEVKDAVMFMRMPNRFKIVLISNGLRPLPPAP